MNSLSEAENVHTVQSWGTESFDKVFQIEDECMDLQDLLSS